GHPEQRRLVAVPAPVPVDAVVAGVELATDEPAPERRIAGVQHGLPGFVPGEQVGVFGETVREILLREPVQYRRVIGIGLLDEFRRGRDVILLTPVHLDLRFGHVRYAGFGRHGSTSSGKARTRRHLPRLWPVVGCGLISAGPGPAGRPAAGCASRWSWPPRRTTRTRPVPR